jgi:aldehyde:ferredoxin oxidoreductase
MRRFIDAQLSISTLVSASTVSTANLGYSRKFVRVNLTEGRVVDEIVDEATLRKYLGGTGIGAKYLYEEVPPNVRWSDPENRLILASGPLGGTRIGGSGSYSVVTKGPLTNGATSTQANGFLGAYLRFSGFDGIIIHGASPGWVYLHIDEDSAQLRDASALLGKDTYETEELIKKQLGKKEREMSVASIGPAGENLVKFAGIFSDFGHSASHNGSGAVLGSKKLKAIAVARGKKTVEVKDKAKLVVIAHDLLDDVRNLTRNVFDWGTIWANIEAYKDHWLPVKNYTTNEWDISNQKLLKFGAEYIRERFEPRPHFCWACQIHHCYMIRIPDGPYAGLVAEEPEYEQFAAWGPEIGQTDACAAIMLSNEVDRLGMDTNEASWVIGLAMECYEKGILTKQQTSGLEMTWGNVEAAKAMLDMITKREGIGDILAEGAMRAAQRIGAEAVNFAIHTRKGNTPRSHDDRARRWEQFDICVSNTGTLENLLPEFYSSLHPTADEWKELSTTEAKTKGRMLLDDSMVTCRFNTRTNLELLSQAVSAVTGWDFTWQEAVDVGYRIVNLLRAFNIRHGLNADLDYPSIRYGSAPPDGPWKGVRMMPYWDKMLRNYYKEMGWDEDTSKPLPETLRKYGLEYVIKDLWETG